MGESNPLLPKGESEEPPGSPILVLPDAVRQAAKQGDVVPLVGTFEKTEADFTGADAEVDWHMYKFIRDVDRGLLVPNGYVEYVEEVASESGAALVEDIPYQQMLGHTNPKRYTNLIKIRPRSLRHVRVDGESCPAPMRGKRRQRRIHGKRTYQWIPDPVVHTDVIKSECVLLYDGTGRLKSPTLRTIERIVPKYHGLCGLSSPYNCDIVEVGVCTPENIAAARKQYAARRAYSQHNREENGKEGYTPPNVGRSLVRRIPGYEIGSVQCRGGRSTTAVGTSRLTKERMVYGKTGGPRYATISSNVVSWFLRNPSGKSPFYDDDEPWPHGIVEGVSETSEMKERGEYVMQVRATAIANFWFPPAEDEQRELEEYAAQLKNRETSYPELKPVDSELEESLSRSERLHRVRQRATERRAAGYPEAQVVIHHEPAMLSSEPLEAELYIPFDGKFNNIIWERAHENVDPVFETEPNVKLHRVLGAYFQKQREDRVSDLHMDTIELSTGTTYTFPLSHPQSVDDLHELLRDLASDYRVVLQKYLMARAFNDEEIIGYVETVNLDSLAMDTLDGMIVETTRVRAMEYGDLVPHPKAWKNEFLKRNDNIYTPPLLCKEVGSRWSRFARKVKYHEARVAAWKYLNGVPGWPKHLFEKPNGFQQMERQAEQSIEEWTSSEEYEARQQREKYLRETSPLVLFLKSAAHSFKSRWRRTSSLPIGPAPRVDVVKQSVRSRFKNWASGLLMGEQPKGTVYEIPVRREIIDGGDYESATRELIRQQQRKYQESGKPFYIPPLDDESKTKVDAEVSYHPITPDVEDTPIDLPVEETVVGPGAYKSKESREEAKLHRESVNTRMMRGIRKRAHALAGKL